MKITKTQLKQIIKEELENVLEGGIRHGLDYQDKCLARKARDVSGRHDHWPEDILADDDFMRPYTQGIGKGYTWKPGDLQLCKAEGPEAVILRAYRDFKEGIIKEEKIDEGLENITPENLKIVADAAQKFIEQPEVLAMVIGTTGITLVNQLADLFKGKKPPEEKLQ